MRPEINLLIKPVSSSCNMECTYCFYVDEAKKENRMVWEDIPTES